MEFIDVRDPRSGDICYCSHTRSVHGGARWKCYAGAARGRFVKTIPCPCAEFAFSRRAPEIEQKIYALEKAARELKQPERFSLDMLNRAVEAAKAAQPKGGLLTSDAIIKRSRFTDADGVVREFTPEFAAREAERAGRIVMKPTAPPCRHPLLRVKPMTSLEVGAPCAICGVFVNMQLWLNEQPRGAFLAAADYAANQVAMQTLPAELQAPVGRDVCFDSDCRHPRSSHDERRGECDMCGCLWFVESQAEKPAPQKEKPRAPEAFSDSPRKFFINED